MRTKRILALLLALMMLFTTGIEVFAAQQMSICIIALPRSADTNKGDWGLQELYLMGGWETIPTESYLVYCKDSHSGQVVYCIEPGHSIKTGNTLTGAGSSYWSNYPSSMNPTLEPEEIKLLVERVMHYGWQGKGDTSWNSTNSSDAEEIAGLIATQMLIWEVVVGERNLSFEHIDPSRRGYDSVMDSISSGNPLYSRIWSSYNSIASAIENHSLIPSFMSDNELFANSEALVWDGSRYVVTLTDTNGVLDDCRLFGDGDIKCTVNGNQITFYTDNADITEINIVAEKTGSRNAMIVWSDGNICGGDQDVVSYGETVDDTIRGYLTLTLSPSAGDLKIVKTSEDGNISGITFNITGNGVNQSVTTGTDGTANVSGLAPGEYMVTEQVPNGYNEQQPKTVFIENGKTAVVEFHNTVKTGDVKIIKTSDDGKVEGITFTVTGSGVNQTVTTDANGTATVTRLKPGSYTVTEQVPTGYAAQAPKTVNVESGKTAEVTFHNVLSVGAVKVIKTAEDNLVSGIKFKLSGTSTNGVAVEEYATTDEQGVAIFENIPIGNNYTVEEMDTHERYVAPVKQTVSVVEHGTAECRFNNVLKKFNIVLKKTDAEQGGAQGHATLQGAVYGLYKNGQLVDSFTTDANGSFTTGYYPCGEGYTVREITPSKGYLIDEREYPISVSAGTFNLENNTVTLNVTEQVIKGNVQLTKVDKDYPENKLTGAKFAVYFDSNGNKTFDDSDKQVSTLTETARGIYGLENLPFGGYFVKETEAPKGFYLDTGAYYFEIAENGKTVTVENEAGKGFVNVSHKGSLKIVKTSSDGKVDGFTFKVTGENGYSKTFVTDKKGEILIENLPIGDYTVSEVSNELSANYIIPASKTASVGENSVTKVEMHNVLRETPKTGDSRMPGLWLTLSGICFIGAAGLAFVAIKRREQDGE